LKVIFTIGDNIYRKFNQERHGNAREKSNTP
jgi:hypothetical protein